MNLKRGCHHNKIISWLWPLIFDRSTICERLTQHTFFQKQTATTTLGGMSVLMTSHERVSSQHFPGTFSAPHLSSSWCCCRLLRLFAFGLRCLGATDLSHNRTGAPSRVFPPFYVVAASAGRSQTFSEMLTCTVYYDYVIKHLRLQRRCLHMYE